MFLMTGLGPITPTYCLIPSKSHVRSLADLALEDPEAIAEIVHLRGQVANLRGNMLMTEHGRVPVCRDGDEHDGHCFHAHALLFQSLKDVESEIGKYYGNKKTFDNLINALMFAATTDHYLLISNNVLQFTIFSQPLNVPRQLARTIVAILEGTPELADWRSTPNEETALAQAVALRKLIEKFDDTTA